MIGMRSDFPDLMGKKCTKCGKKGCDCKKHMPEMFSMKEDHEEEPVKTAKKAKKKQKKA